MKKTILILAILVIARISSNAQSAVAIFKPLYSGDEHYAIVSNVSTESEARKKALESVSSVVNQKLGSTANEGPFIYMSTSKKGYFAVGRGKDQYGHYLHYEAVLGYSDGDAANRAVLSRLSGRGLYDAEIVDSGSDN
jgi:hypothetical protein